MIKLLIKRLIQDFPQFNFVTSDIAHWSANEQTIYYTDDDIQTLHELGHALLQHDQYGQDVELLKLERDAWDKARELGAIYRVSIDDNTVEDALDSYREWLHQRSRCPRCHQTGVQNHQDLLYRCPNCKTTWAPNSAKQCQLRRYIKKPTSRK